MVKICKDEEQAYKAENKPLPKSRVHPNWVGVFSVLGAFS